METSSLDECVVINPSTKEKLYQIIEATQLEIDEIYKRSKELQLRIGSMSVKQRMQEVFKLRDYIIANQETIIDRIVSETGKPRFDALVSEIFEVCDVIDYMKGVAEKMLKDEKVHTPIVLMGKKSKVVYEPLGTVLIITPWNYPFFQGMVPSIMAFLAGNSVIVKPSEYTPLKGLWEEITEKSGFMKDAFQFVYGGKNTGEALIDAKPDKIHFTGSVATGKVVMKKASEHLIPVDLELGGKDPAIVFDDVNLEKTANGVLWAAFTNAGQSCTSIERLYVHEKIYDEFVKVLLQKVKQLIVSADDKADMGAMTTERQINIVEDHIKDAVEKGAKVLFGGNRREGTLIFEPTILSDITNEMLVAKDETFGPVLPIIKFNSEDEVIEKANKSDYGLSASVWSKDLMRADRVARKLKVGNVSINSHMLTEGNPALPFGGVKSSGMGRSKGKWGLHSFCNIKSVITDVQSSKIETHWYPYTESKYKVLTDLIKSLFSKDKNLIKFVFTGLKADSIGSKERLK